MLDFSGWVSSLANSIEDKSFVPSKKQPAEYNSPPPLVTRMHMADLAVPNVDGLEALRKWILVFGVYVACLNDVTKLISMNLLIESPNDNDSYLQLKNDEEAVLWLHNFKNKLKDV